MDTLGAPRTSHLVLSANLGGRFDREPEVLRLTDDAATADPERHAILMEPNQVIPPGFAAYLYQRMRPEWLFGSYQLPESLFYLMPGDVIRLSHQTGDLWVMYRRNSNTNSMLVTEQCNSWCVMCSQPPKSRDDSAIAGVWLEAIPLISPETSELGITGGEPLLLGDRFFELVAACKTSLPTTALHILSNGRLFNYLKNATRLQSLAHPDLMVGVPLYSDLAWRHDFVVQREGAFDQTIRGLINLARCRVAVEIRIVFHRWTADRLQQLCRFIARNLPFAAHVAIMGLEPIGFARGNLPALWVDPADYHDTLENAVELLCNHGLNASLYNFQRCTIPQSLWPYARQSISDWKNIFLPACNSCSVQPDCAGLFHSASKYHSRNIHPILK